MLRRFLPLLLAGFFFIATSLFFSRGLDFPPFYHPDEINKVLQVRDNYRNFNHPQLMLNTAEVVYRLAGSPRDTRQIAIFGRWVSVFFSAMAVALLSLAAYMLAGPVAQVCCGLLLVSEPKLFEFAHYFKEDPSLAMGFAALFAAFLFFEKKPGLGRVALVGLATALAISAKYIGVMPAVLTLAALVWMVWKRPETGARKSMVGVFLLALLVGLLVINWQIWADFHVFQHGLGREVTLFQKKTDSLINSDNFRELREQFDLWALLALSVWVAAPWFQGRRRTVGEWLILAATLGYALMLSFSTRSASRYLLPIAAALPLILAVAACWLGAAVCSRLKKPAWWGQAAFCSLFLFIVLENIPVLQRFEYGFRQDTRLDLVRFIRASLPREAVLAEDSKVKLPDARDVRRDLPGWNLEQKTIEPPLQLNYLAEAYTLDDLLKQGVTHVVITNDGPARAALKHPDRRPSAKDERVWNFVRDLEARGRLIWSCPPGSPDYVRPSLRLYALNVTSPPP